MVVQQAKAVDIIKLPTTASFQLISQHDAYIFLSVSDEGIAFGPGTPYHDITAKCPNGVHVFAENLQVVESWSTIGQPLTLSAFAIEAQSRPGADNVIVRTTGADGTPNYTGGPTDRAKVNGKPAGAAGIFIQSYTPSNVLKLGFDASGGAGAETREIGAQGGDGGNAAQLTVRVWPLYQDYMTMLELILEDARFKLDVDSPLVKPLKDDPAYFAASQFVQVVGKDLASDLDAALKDMETSGATVNALKDALYKCGGKVFNDIHSQHATLVQSCSSNGGAPNGGWESPGGQRGPAGTEGKSVPKDVDFCQEPADMSDASFIFVHPTQCQMLLDKANFYDFVSTKKCRTIAASLYDRLVNRLAFLDSPEDAAIWKAYKDPMNALLFGDPEAALIQLREIRSAARSNYDRLTTTSTDFYGYTTDWVPRMSFSDYHDIVHLALAELVNAETSYIEYMDALSKQQDLNDSVRKITETNDARLSALLDDIKELARNLAQTENCISAAITPIETSHAVLLQVIKDLGDKIKNSTQLSIPSFINAISQCVFAPESPMPLVQAGSLAFEGIKDLPNDSGVPIAKSYLVGKVQSVAATVDDIKANLGKPLLDGTFKLDDPNGTKLIMEEKDLEKFISDYTQSVLASDFENLVSAFKDLTTKVCSRNADVVTYNVIVTLIIQKFQQMDSIKKKGQDLQNKVIHNNDPDLAGITAFIKTVYEYHRNRVMKYITFYHRALRFRTFSTTDVMDKIENSPDAASAATSIAFQTIVDRIEEDYQQYMEDSSSIPTCFPPDWITNPDEIGERISLTKGQTLALRSASGSHKASVDLSNLISSSDPSNPFVDRTNVRVYRVNLRITGLKATEKAKVSGIITHTGKEVILTRGGLPFQFDHDSIPVPIQYYLYPDGRVDVEERGTIAAIDPVTYLPSKYAPPGPFAIWDIDMSDTEWSKLDASKAQFELEFMGTLFAPHKATHR